MTQTVYILSYESAYYVTIGKSRPIQ